MPKPHLALLAALLLAFGVQHYSDQFNPYYLDVLTGIGKFYVVGPPPFGTFAINALPEQADGLRFLADIRSVVYFPDIASIALRIRLISTCWIWTRSTRTGGQGSMNS